MVGCFLFLDHDRMVLDNFATLIWLTFGFCFDWSMSNDLTGVSFDLDLYFGFCSLFLSTVIQLVIIIIIYCFGGVILVPYLGIPNAPWVLAEMGDSLLSEPTLTAEPAPSSAAATPTPAAAESGVSLAPPTSTAAATSPGAANMDLLGGQ